MIEHITYKTKLEELLDITQIVEIINKFTRNFEQNYAEKNQNNKNINDELAIINNKIVEFAKEQRRKELEKLLEKITERLTIIDKQLYNINNEILRLKNQNSLINDLVQKEYEYNQLLKIHHESKQKLEEKKRKIYDYLSVL